MGLNISGVTLLSVSSPSRIVVTNNSNILELRNDGMVRLPQTPMFTAGCTNSTTDPAIVPGLIWRKMLFSAVTNNVGGCFSSSRFTAPVSGTYYFSANCYGSLGAAANADYAHTMFWVNGSAGTRRNGSAGYRIRGYGRPASLAFDLQVNEIYSLTAGDYVEHYTYTTATAVLYPYYNQFNGVLLG